MSEKRGSSVAYSSEGRDLAFHKLHLESETAVRTLFTAMKNMKLLDGFSTLEFHKSVINPFLADLLEKVDGAITHKYHLNFVRCEVEPVLVDNLNGVTMIQLIDVPLNNLRIGDNCPNLRDVSIRGKIYEEMPPVDKILPLSLPELYFSDVVFSRVTVEDMERLEKFEKLAELCFANCDIRYFEEGKIPSLENFHYPENAEFDQKFAAFLMFKGVKFKTHEPGGLSTFYRHSNKTMPTDRLHFHR
ncbi:MAG: hypothetical protein ACXAE3_08750 [Candidatus Kariarchaeaceae archaeon]|jgi:hypothetical protein